ncbi:MAG: DHA2 family efflux MFS transporter permease subunit [Dehalococcoidia bacterium]|nr:MAG: DHA2 family efflux MFS transporter permease subunit [Dehalococcoidia bacterium]
MNAQVADRQRWAIMLAVMLGLFLSAMDSTIVGTAMPRVIADLSGLELYSWVFTSYMLASTTSVPIVGKMGDIYGRKQFFLAGIVIFLAGSILSGASQSMTELILFRGVQGLGGGFIFANAFAIVGDLFAPAERGRYTGIMSGVFGLASVIGPLVGGAITDNLSWRWVFYVNIPLGLVALATISMVLPASQPRGAGRKLDYLGAIALAGTVAPLLLGFSWAGNEYGWTAPQVAGCFVVSAVLLAVLLVIEMRAAEPIVPLRLFRNRIFAVAIAATFISGVGLYAGAVYIPLFMQGVLHFSATNAGLVTTPMMVAMVCGSLIGGQVVSRTGKYKWITVLGMGISATGMFMLSMLTSDSSQARGMMDMAVLGFGLGFTIPTLTLAAQNAVPYSMLGVVSAFTQFARSVGGTIGVAIMGSVMTRQLDSHLAGGLSPEVQQGAPAPLLEALKSPRVLLDSHALNLLHDEGFVPIFGADADRLFNGTVASMKTALAASITDIFFISTMIMLTAFAVTFLLAELPLRVTNEAPSAFETPPDVEPEPAPAHAAEVVARSA